MTLSRECRAIQIPEGLPTVLPEGSRVLITQQLGGSYTVMTERGALFRIDEKDGDALGRETTATGAAADEADLSLEDRVWRQLKKCYDPEIPVNIVDLGLLYSCELDAEARGTRLRSALEPEHDVRGGAARARFHVGRSSARAEARTALPLSSRAEARTALPLSSRAEARSAGVEGSCPERPSPAP